MYVIGKQESAAVARVIKSGQLFRYHKGKTAVETAQLEKALAKTFGVKHALALSSGTGSLICALAGMGVGPGDEVIVPGYTYIATPLAVLAVGAVPIIAEIDESLTLDPDDFQRKITRYTKAVIPVDMNGLPCDMAGITRVARKRGIEVLEDACQAVGGGYRGKRLGSIGRAGALSFNYYKNISSGEGGAMLTNDSDLFARAMVCHDCGSLFFDERLAASKPTFFAGLNFRISEIQSAILNVQLQRLDGILGDLRARKAAMLDVLAAARSFRPSRVNDLKGDCANTLGLHFKTVAQAIAFTEFMAPVAPCARPFNSGRHVYWSWEPVLQRRGLHQGLNPWKMAGRDIRQGKNCCPVTRDILARTVNVPVPFDKTVAQAKAIARHMLKFAD